MATQLHLSTLRKPLLCSSTSPSHVLRSFWIALTRAPRCYSRDHQRPEFHAVMRMPGRYRPASPFRVGARKSQVEQHGHANASMRYSEAQRMRCGTHSAAVRGGGVRTADFDCEVQCCCQSSWQAERGGTGNRERIIFITMLHFALPADAPIAYHISSQIVRHVKPALAVPHLPYCISPNEGSSSVSIQP